MVALIVITGSILKNILLELPLSHAYVLSHFTHVQLFATPWTVDCQTPLSMKFSRQEYWNGLLYPPLGDLPNPGIKPMSLPLLALAGRFFITSTTWGAPHSQSSYVKI